MYNRTALSQPLKTSSNIEGFSLIEMLVVLAIMAMITTLVAPQVLRYYGTAKAQAAQAQIKNFAGALELYYIDVGQYPDNNDGLGALSIAPASSPGWNGPYIKGAENMKDPWGYPYEYQADGGSFSIVSLGRDGKSGGDGLDSDIRN